MSPRQPWSGFIPHPNLPLDESPYNPHSIDTYHACITKGFLPSPQLITSYPRYANLRTSGGSQAEGASTPTEHAGPPTPQSPEIPHVNWHPYNSFLYSPSMECQHANEEEENDDDNISTLDLNDSSSTDTPRPQQANHYNHNFSHNFGANSPATMLAEAEAQLDLLMERDRHDRLRWQAQTPVEGVTPPRERAIYDEPCAWLRQVDRKLLEWRAKVLQRQQRGDDDDDDEKNEDGNGDKTPVTA